LFAYADRLSAGKPPRDALFQYSVALSGLVVEAFILGIVLWIARGVPRQELGLQAPRSWAGALGLAAALFVALLIVEQVLEHFLHATREQGLEPTHWEPSKAVPFALNAAVVVLVAPFVEELTYRGLGFAVLRPYGAIVAVIGTAIAFAAAHGLVSGFLALFVFGAAIAILRLRTGSVFPGMLFHACFNGAALGLAFVR
jgi:membrane protease YdiL (CAAX protease family)